LAEPVPLPLGRTLHRDPYPDSPFGWYGAEPAFQILVERNMAKVEGIARPITRVQGSKTLRYEVVGLEVPGDLERHDLAIVFHCGLLGEWACGIAACDYPAVFTSVDRPRKHQNPNGSLCLWAPFDPPERRWWHGDGLKALVEIVRRHLLLELHWWRTGGEWAVEDAPHGLSEGAR
jgi:hypothetical protein